MPFFSEIPTVHHSSLVRFLLLKNNALPNANVTHEISETREIIRRIDPNSGLFAVRIFCSAMDMRFIVINRINTIVGHLGHIIQSHL
jgi:hypothetical protein